MALIRKIAATLATSLLCAVASAQGVVKMVTGASAGSAMDTLARAVAEPMSAALKRTIIVESRPGAAYNLAADHVAKAAPDGNTILVTFNAHPIAGLLYPVPFDPVKDFAAVGLIASVPYVVVAHPSVPGANLKEMLALAKAQGRAPAYATIGPGTPHHLMMEGVKGQTGADIRMVHYKSAVQAQTDVVGGHVDFALLTRSALIDAQAKEGKLKVIAVTTEQRLPEHPDAPTVTEMGFQGFVADGWYAMLVPAKTPAAIVRDYNEALARALASSGVADLLRPIRATAMPSAPEVLERRIASDTQMWRRIIAENRIKVD